MLLRLQQKPFFFFLLSFTIWSWWTLDGVVSEPQTIFVRIGCSQINVSDVSIFQNNLNATFRDMRAQISNQSKHFTTAEVVKGDNPTYGLFQCRNYLSIADCLSCFDFAAVQIRNCSASVDGAQIIYDGCLLRYESNTFFNQSTDAGNNIYCGNETRNSTELASTVQQVIKNLEIATPRINGDASTKKAIIGGVVGGVSTILIILALFALYIRAKSSKTVPTGDILEATELKGPVNYRYKDLKSATKNFSEKNKLGEQAFGDVYKGTLKNGKVVAIKKLVLGQSKQTEKEFVSEVKLISNIHHRNIVRLLGCCNKGQERFLVYEYMKNKNVGQFLYGENKGSLNWAQRYGIILGTARGLAYLHEEFHICIIHRDVKTSNILLGDDFQPKISDFGLAKLLPRDQSRLNEPFAGTMGYVAPEYAMHGQLSKKVDTSSYGVVVLEIISGEKSNSLKVDDSGEYLLQKAWKLYERGMHIEFVDETLDTKEYHVEEVKKIIEIGLLCTQASPVARPKMSQIVRMLKRKSLMEHDLPTMPIYVHPRFGSRRETLVNNGSSSSNATMSTSTLSGR
ncbi:putative receptor-like protein kinase At4g00960 [Neltuma alba]|uniref:putative receptor-like protein kinase At4g00960 n=1 Tax=Neltuma alba TaxID=207710 RepID=UPI0010A2CA8A|nr:putative receptor-like protein kinase At4g00960 [Prosopis alba]